MSSDLSGNELLSAAEELHDYLEVPFKNGLDLSGYSATLSVPVREESRLFEEGWTGITSQFDQMFGSQPSIAENWKVGIGVIPRPNESSSTESTETQIDEIGITSLIIPLIDAVPKRVELGRYDKDRFIGVIARNGDRYFAQSVERGDGKIVPRAIRPSKVEDFLRFAGYRIPRSFSDARSMRLALYDAKQLAPTWALTQKYASAATAFHVAITQTTKLDLNKESEELELESDLETIFTRYDKDKLQRRQFAVKFVGDLVLPTLTIRDSIVSAKVSDLVQRRESDYVGAHEPIEIVPSARLLRELLDTAKKALS